MSDEDYYAILRLQPSADHVMVGQTYWHLARKYQLEMEEDPGAKRRLEELNEAFAVLGNPVERAAYDAARAAEAERDRESATHRRRVSIEVSYWRLPAWQGVLAATGGIALAALAFFAGASPAATLALAAVTVTAALLPMRDEWRPPVREDDPWSSQGERELKALELERSTAAVVARWREMTSRRQHPLTLSRLGLREESPNPPNNEDV